MARMVALYGRVSAFESGTMGASEISYALGDIVLLPAPITPSWIEEGDPRASAALVARSTDGSTTTFVWECTAGKFTWRYGGDETVHFLEGSVVISSEGMPPRRFGRGDTIHFTRGSKATWVVDDRIRKVAFCRGALPAPLQRLMRVARNTVRRFGIARLRSGGSTASATTGTAGRRPITPL
jgi:uncharacterized protein